MVHFVVIAQMMGGGLKDCQDCPGHTGCYGDQADLLVPARQDLSSVMPSRRVSASTLMPSVNVSLEYKF